jgi:hypothetical protein
LVLICAPGGADAGNIRYRQRRRLGADRRD